MGKVIRERLCEKEGLQDCDSREKEREREGERRESERDRETNIGT